MSVIGLDFDRKLLSTQGSIFTAREKKLCNTPNEISDLAIEKAVFGFWAALSEKSYAFGGRLYNSRRIFPGLLP
jgi:hypothetical protein